MADRPRCGSYSRDTKLYSVIITFSNTNFRSLISRYMLFSITVCREREKKWVKKWKFSGRKYIFMKNKILSREKKIINSRASSSSETPEAFITIHCRNIIILNVIQQTSIFFAFNNILTLYFSSLCFKNKNSLFLKFHLF